MNFICNKLTMLWLHITTLHCNNFRIAALVSAVDCAPYQAVTHHAVSSSMCRRDW